MEKSDDPDASFDAEREATPPGKPPVAGDADDVEGTTYVVGKGTDERADRSPEAADPFVERSRTDRDAPPRRGTGGLT